MGNKPDTNSQQQNSKTPMVASSDELIKNKQLSMPVSFLSRHERVAFSAMIKIAYDEMMKNPTQSVFSIDTKDFMRMIGIDVKKWKYTSLFIREKTIPDPFSEDDTGVMKVPTDDYAVERTLLGLLGKEVMMRYKDEKEKQLYEVRGTVLVSDFTISKETVTFSFGNWVRDKVVVCGNVYVSQMETLTLMKSTYSVALFEQLEQRRDFKKWEIGVKAFRAIMGIEDENKYKRFTNLRARVIDKAVKEIEKYTDYKITTETEKKGTRIVKIIFYWHIDKQRKEISAWKKKIRKKFLGKQLLKDGERIIYVGERGYLQYEDTGEFLEKHHAVNVWKKLYENKDLIIGEENKNSNPPENKGIPQNIARNNKTIEIANNYNMKHKEEYEFERFKRHYVSIGKSRESWLEVWENWIEGASLKEKPTDLFSVETAKKQEYHLAVLMDAEIREKLKLANIDVEALLNGTAVSNEIAYQYINSPKGGQVGVFYYTDNRLPKADDSKGYIEAEIA